MKTLIQKEQKIKWNLVNLAFWAEIMLSYLLPFHVVDNFRYQVGFPLPFLTVYAGKIGMNPFSSMSLNPLILLLDTITLYLMILLVMKIYGCLKHLLSQRTEHHVK